SDGGESWSAIEVGKSASGSSLDSAVVDGAFAVVGESLFIGLNDPRGPARGVYRSSDRGASWQPIANGRLTNASVLALGSHGRQVLAWTQSYGVWRRSIDEIVASSPLDEPAPLRPFRMMPNPASSLVDIDVANLAELTVTDALGRRVIVTGASSFDTSTLSNGLYVVVARDRVGAVTSATLLVRH
ncbi:MAG TPA: T9SS type A sorting domain-containing protein, partial [Candidatus Kapabacteria bacterium]|nr:T9SS type A sorting domain-containing protein [Candidatus Kapabacteria bacterium]